MAVPKKRTSSSKSRMRRSHDSLKKINVSMNSSGDHQRSHHIGPDGTYRGRQVLTKKKVSSENS